MCLIFNVIHFILLTAITIRLPSANKVATRMAKNLTCFVWLNIIDSSPWLMLTFASHKSLILHQTAWSRPRLPFLFRDLLLSLFLCFTYETQDDVIVGLEWTMYFKQNERYDDSEQTHSMKFLTAVDRSVQIKNLRWWTSPLLRQSKRNLKSLKSKVSVCNICCVVFFGRSLFALLSNQTIFI